MDVSGSMNEHMKELAKVFFILLYLFVTRCYRHVDIVFIRHTDSAQEVDEDTFFYSSETGGTRVSAALEEMLTIVRKRYSPLDWNIYLAQASDGDNFTRDNPRTRSEEHTSELQSLMRISYAVFCLKKKKQKTK